MRSLLFSSTGDILLPPEDVCRPAPRPRLESPVQALAAEVALESGPIEGVRDLYRIDIDTNKKKKKK